MPAFANLIRNSIFVLFFSRKTIIYKLVKDLSSLAISFNFSIYCANLILLSLETKFFHIVTPDSCQLYTPPLPVHIPYATNRPTEFSRVFALAISFALEMPPSGSPLSVNWNPIQCLQRWPMLLPLENLSWSFQRYPLFSIFYTVHCVFKGSFVYLLYLLFQI